MTPLQSAFVDEYLIDLNATQAAIRAGYSVDTARQIGCENLAKPDIADAIAVAKAKRSEETGVTAVWVLTEAKSVYDEARKIGKLPDALKALEICGKHVDVQAFKERIEHTGKNGGPIQTEDRTTASLIAEAKRLGIDPTAIGLA
jgi:phage terminase small subunit